MLVLAVLGRYVQWCNPAALLLKGFKRAAGEPVMTAPHGSQLLTVPRKLYQASRMESLLQADSLHGLKCVEVAVSCT